jgi:hypothetical protein
VNNISSRVAQSEIAGLIDMNTGEAAEKPVSCLMDYDTWECQYGN